MYTKDYLKKPLNMLLLLPKGQLIDSSIPVGVALRERKVSIFYKAYDTYFGCAANV